MSRFPCGQCGKAYQWQKSQAERSVTSPARRGRPRRKSLLPRLEWTGPAMNRGAEGVLTDTPVARNPLVAAQPDNKLSGPPDEERQSLRVHPGTDSHSIHLEFLAMRRQNGRFERILPLAEIAKGS